MPRSIIVHTSDICGDGIGDLYYLLNSVKVFTRFHQGPHQHLVAIFADNLKKVEEVLISLHEVEPEHPIFKFFSVANGSIKPVVVADIKIGSLAKSIQPTMAIDITSIFPHITQNDVINIVISSVSGNTFIKNTKNSVRVDQVLGILEFDALPTFAKCPGFATLGLEQADLGLLHDIDGITGTEDIEDYLQNLSPATKQLLFQDASISIAAAKSQLTETPSVFAYLFPLYNANVLEAAFQSAIIQKAITQGKTPLFFISNLYDGIKLPSSIQKAAQEGKIRIVATWLPTKEFKSVNAIFMNHATQSIVIPSGDNTLTACIKTGKFPLYAHKSLHDASKTVADFMKSLTMVKDYKLNIFISMLKILKSNATKLGWDKCPGFNDCKKALEYISQATYNTKESHEAAKHLHTFITAEMVSFFRVKFAPYLMENFAFEKISLPRMLSMLKKSPDDTKPTVLSTTVQFDRTKAAPTKNDTTRDSDAPTFAGFKKGFLSNGL